MSEIRLTSARVAILDVLKATDTHLSPVEIHEELQDRLPSLNISTVYRSLDYLVEHDLISITDLGTGTPLYEKLNENPHHHLVCLNCKEILDLDHKLVAPFFDVIEEKKSFEVETKHLVLFGTCEHCQ